MFYVTKLCKFLNDVMWSFGNKYVEVALASGSSSITFLLSQDTSPVATFVHDSGKTVGSSLFPSK